MQINHYYMYCFSILQRWLMPRPLVQWWRHPPVISHGSQSDYSWRVACWFNVNRIYTTAIRMHFHWRFGFVRDAVDFITSVYSGLQPNKWLFYTWTYLVVAGISSDVLQFVCRFRQDLSNVSILFHNFLDCDVKPHPSLPNRLVCFSFLSFFFPFFFYIFPSFCSRIPWNKIAGFANFQCDRKTSLWHHQNRTVGGGQRINSTGLA